MKSESSRWYDPKTGQCVLDVIGKNGKPRKPNIKDAITNWWLPSVTTIMQVKSKPGLEKWKQQQVLMAALTSTRLEGETDEVFCNRIIDDSQEISKKAIETGKDFHAAAEMFIKDHIMYNTDPAINTFLSELHEILYGFAVRFGPISWVSEKPFVNLELEFAGTPDLVGLTDNHLIVIDYKTCDLDKWTEPYPEHQMQIAAGCTSLNYGGKTNIGFNIYVDRNSGKLLVREWSYEEIDKGWDAFKACNILWKFDNKWEERKAACATASKVLA